MAINLVYGPDEVLAGQLAQQAGHGEFLQAQDERLRALDQFNQQLDENARQFDQRLAYGAQQDSAQLQQQTAQRSQQGQIAQADIQARAQQEGYNRQNKWGLEAFNQQGQQNNIAAQGANQQNVANINAAQQQREAMMQQAFKEHDAATQAWMKGDTFTSPELFQKFKERYDQRWAPFGITFGGMDETLQHDATQQAVQKVLPFLRSTLTFNGQPMFGDGELSQFVNADGTVNEDLLFKTHDSMIKGKQAEFEQGPKALEMHQKEEKHQQDMQHDNAATDLKIANQQREAENARQQQQRTFETQQRSRFSDAKSKWATNRAKWNADEATRAAKAKEAGTSYSAQPYDVPAPTWDEFKPIDQPPPTLADVSVGTHANPNQQPTLQPGDEIVVAPDGRRGIKHANGRVTPIP